MTQVPAAHAHSRSQMSKSKHINQNGHQMPTPTMLDKDTSIYPPAHINTHLQTQRKLWKTLAGVHFHTESKQPFCPKPPSGSESSCCHCSSVKRRRAELWLSASCHCMCVQLERGLWGLGKCPSHRNPSPFTTTHCTRQRNSRSRMWPCAVLPLSHVAHIHKIVKTFPVLHHLGSCHFFFYIIFWRVCSIKCPVLSRISQESFSEAKISKWRVSTKL